MCEIKKQILLSENSSWKIFKGSYFVFVDFVDNPQDFLWIAILSAHEGDFFASSKVIYEFMCWVFHSNDKKSSVDKEKVVNNWILDSIYWKNFKSITENQKNIRKSYE